MRGGGVYFEQLGRAWHVTYPDSWCMLDQASMMLANSKGGTYRVAVGQLVELALPDALWDTHVVARELCWAGLALQAVAGVAWRAYSAG